MRDNMTHYSLPMLTKTLSGHKTLWLVLALGWSAVIMVLCLVRFNELPQVKLAEADKYVHAIFHFLFTLLWFGYARTLFSRALAKVFVASVAYGGLIEILQGTLTTTRQADLKDVLANTTGALLAVILIATLQRYRRNA